MKKLLIFILIVGGSFVYANRDTYGPKIQNVVNQYVPESIQKPASLAYTSLKSAYISVTNVIDMRRASLKEWSLERSDQIIEQAQIADPRDHTFSPLFSNITLVLGSDLAVATKIFALFLIVVTLVTWNRLITLLILGFFFWGVIKSTISTIRRKRKKTFFDKIGENIPQEEWER